MFNIDKMVVAADESPREANPESTSITDAISALRQGIENGEVNVTPTGGAVPTIQPIQPMEMPEPVGGVPNPPEDFPGDDASATPAQPPAPQPNSTNIPHDEWKMVPKATVAADNSVADAIANMRQNLANGEVHVNSDGTVYNPGTPATQSSIANGDSFKPVPKATVAGRQWYEENPDLQRAEIAAMADTKPDAKWGYLPNGKMYWEIHLRPVNAAGQARNWTLLGVYDEDHPQQRWGGSVKFYPVSPNYDEMMELVRQSNVTPKRIPHLLRDSDNQVYMCSQDRNRIQDGHRKGELVTTGATGLRFAMRWINVFELGLLDQQTWTMFQGEGQI